MIVYGKLLQIIPGTFGKSTTFARSIVGIGQQTHLGKPGIVSLGHRDSLEEKAPWFGGHLYLLPSFVIVLLDEPVNLIAAGPEKSYPTNCSAILSLGINIPSASHPSGVSQPEFRE
jgi:hypothetical protein